LTNKVPFISRGTWGHCLGQPSITGLIDGLFTDLRVEKHTYWNEFEGWQRTHCHFLLNNLLRQHVWGQPKLFSVCRLTSSWFSGCKAS
jgi:hypothetical protein